MSLMSSDRLTTDTDKSPMGANTAVTAVSGGGPASRIWIRDKLPHALGIRKRCSRPFDSKRISNASNGSRPAHRMRPVASTTPRLRTAIHSNV